jgi:hypothetical protein
VNAPVPGNLRTAVDLIYKELSGQTAAAGALDAKLLALLGFWAVLGSALATLSGGLHHGRVILLVGIAAGAATCLIGSFASKDPTVGPPAQTFYADYGGASEDDFLRQLLSDLVATVQSNNTALEFRRKALTLTLALPLLAAVVFGLVRLY